MLGPLLARLAAKQHDLDPVCCKSHPTSTAAQLLPVQRHDFGRPQRERIQQGEECRIAQVDGSLVQTCQHLSQQPTSQRLGLSLQADMLAADAVKHQH